MEREDKTIREKLLGQYVVPLLRMVVPGGELQLNPIALHVSGGDGRVDLEALPTLSRVKLVDAGRDAIGFVKWTSTPAAPVWPAGG